jgi:septal ring factor EnvC (AmiA/AmiB activator)
MTPPETPCNEHETQIQQNTREIAELQTRADYKEKRIDELYNKMEKMETKLDKVSDNVNELLLQSKQGDANLELRLKAIETELAVQKEVSQQNHNRFTILLAVVGVGLTIITILINVYFNIIH